MTSLTEQMIQLKNQQEVLLAKIINEEEMKVRVGGFNIERLEFVVKNLQTGIHQERKFVHRQGLGRYYRDGFEVILEIFKKQDKKIKALEEMVLSSQINPRKNNAAEELKYCQDQVESARLQEESETQAELEEALELSRQLYISQNKDKYPGIHFKGNQLFCGPDANGKLYQIHGSFPKEENAL